MPSPQTGAHELPPGQLQPASTWQVAEQPSLAAVLPSSHASPASSAPLPQTAVGALPMVKEALP